MRTEDTFGAELRPRLAGGDGIGGARGGIRSSGACLSSHTPVRRKSGVPKKYRNEASPSEDTFWGSGGGERWEG